MIKINIKGLDGTGRTIYRNKEKFENIEISVAMQGMNKTKFKKLVKGINEVFESLEPKQDGQED